MGDLFHIENKNGSRMRKIQIDLKMLLITIENTKIIHHNGTQNESVFIDLVERINFK